MVEAWFTILYCQCLLTAESFAQQVNLGHQIYGVFV